MFADLIYEWCIREKEQSLIAGLRAMNEPLLHHLKPLEELEQVGIQMQLIYHVSKRLKRSGRAGVIPLTAYRRLHLSRNLSPNDFLSF